MKRQHSPESSINQACETKHAHRSDSSKSSSGAHTMTVNNFNISTGNGVGNENSMMDNNFINLERAAAGDSVQPYNGKMKRQCLPDTSASNLCAAKQASHPDSLEASSSGAHSTTVNHFYNISNSSCIAFGKHSKVTDNILKSHEQSAGDNEQPQTKRSKQEEVVSEEDSSNLSEQKLSNEDKCKTLLQVCRWIHEANDENLTRDIVAHLPDHIMLQGEILPSDVSNVFYALRFSSKLHTMDVVFCIFTGISLKLFSEELSSFNVKIQHFYLVFFEKKLSNEDFSAVVEISQHVEELLWLRCGITSCQVSSLAEKLRETGHKIQDLDLSYNNLGDQGFINLFLCLKNIQKLRLCYCDISSAGCVEFAEKLIESGHKLEVLGLGGNKLIGDKGARSLIPCLHLIENLLLYGCNVTYAVKEEIRSELERLGRPKDGVKFIFF